ncbi:hypothetical protein QH494_03790 [Sphingomonas sp. AR_OL41]|uniref:hypothetical protein n=1 Tax=Sphingomonas sp. AR_OL41 TaxID=3042729 RepID=UPI00247FCC15|nr:hypothetical protein [Sphingomonas sp. AR_OL41]MDH7971292.1 hypothetical protein [Sphingomonas sp. AR_OL41]
MSDLPTLLGREPYDDEARGWATLSPSLRVKAADRVALMNRWWGERGGLSADEAAVIADVTTKRFYQMASAWRKRPGLLAVGAYAAASPDRSTRIHPVVNALLQKHVVKAVASSDEDRTVEWIRRKLEAMVREELPEQDGEGKTLAIPSPNIVRAVIVREQNRVADTKLLGESIVLDCCPVSMRRPDGIPYALFVVIDRGTLRIMGHGLGSVDASVEGYALAAASTADWIARSAGTRLPWAPATRRADLVVGNDRAACDALFARHKALAGHFEFAPVTNERRFGSQIRRYVGERVGRVMLRPTWVREVPPLADGEEVYDDREAAERVAAEVELYNGTMPLRRSGVGAEGAPKALLEFLRLLSA